MLEVRSISKEYRINDEIHVKEVRVIDPEGNQLGILPTSKALQIAEEQSLDLVEVSPQGTPPVCRVMDFGKFKFSQSKKDKEVRKKQKYTEVKEVKLRPKIDVHDMEVKSRMVRRLLCEGDKVKVTIMFRGREVAHASQGEKLLNHIAENTSDISTIERHAKLEGRNMIMILAPKLDHKQTEKGE